MKLCFYFLHLILVPQIHLMLDGSLPHRFLLCYRLLLTPKILIIHSLLLLKLVFLPFPS
ncbi:hypothetical protein L798_07025 [Zootermopsis nevadensis]|uniref:Uncharacterized protein n=1 Tax=Zootermopsis nevadensis TaxID=136037 RepID=A0A067RHP5_ZOONE|nr:hypothetical protein L798_07025 [Zootermopsis nevadensis]